MKGKMIKILAIDDNLDNIITLKAVINQELEKIEFFSALNGQKGIELAADVNPDVILLDIVMPDMDGFEVCKRLKSDEVLSEIPVVFVTALKGDTGSKILALESGAEAFLTKPIDVSELKAQISAMYKIKRANEQKRYENKRLAELVNERTKEYIIENLARKESEKALLEAQTLAHIGSFQFDASSNTITCTDEGLEICGMERKDFSGRVEDVFNLIHPQDVDKVKLQIEKAVCEKKIVEYKCRILRTDGDMRIVNVRLHIFVDDDGNHIKSAGTVQDITEWEKAQKALKESEERFEALFNQAPIGYQSLDKDGFFVEVNQQWLNMLGYEKDEVVGKWFGDFVCQEYKQDFINRFPIFKAQGKIRSVFEMPHKNGERMKILFEGKIGHTIDYKFKQTHCVLQDITQQSIMENALKESEERYKSLFENSGLGIGYYTVDGIVISYNYKAAKNMGGKPEDFVGRSIYDIFTKSVADVYMERISKASRSATPNEYEDHVTSIIPPCWFLRTFSRVMDSSGNVAGVQIVSLDISKRKNAEDDLRYLSYHDQLTGIYNRRFFEEQLISLYTEINIPLSVFMTDVNGLKLINDSFGHSIGDELLKTASETIKRVCRDDDIFARLGGDEFAVLLTKTDRKETENLVGRMKRELAKEKVASVDLSISFGYDTKTLSKTDIKEVLKGAEDSMYKHKVFESSSMHSKTVNIIMNTLFEKSERELLHSKRVSKYCEALAIKLGMENDAVSQIRTAGLLHDIGKIGIDESVLNKPGKLEYDEWEEMKKHSESSWRILISSDEFSNLAEFVLQHHERWDGNGYPNGLKGEEISLEARIIALADSYDAMTSERTYRKAMREDDAVQEIRKCMGKQFDPRISKVFINDVLGFK